MLFCFYFYNKKLYFTTVYHFVLFDTSKVYIETKLFGVKKIEMCVSHISCPLWWSKSIFQYSVLGGWPGWGTVKEWDSRKHRIWSQSRGDGGHE